MRTFTVMERMKGPIFIKFNSQDSNDVNHHISHIVTRHWSTLENISQMLFLKKIHKCNIFSSGMWQVINNPCVREEQV